MGLSHSQALDIVQSNLPDSLLIHYGLAKSQTKQVGHISQLIPLLIAFCTDEIFSSSIHRFIHEFSKTGAKVYGYHLDRGNSFPGPMNNIAHHAIDLQYIFGNFRDGFPDKKDVELSNTIMNRWIDFANGKEPWDDVSTGKELHITPEAELVVVPRGEITSRRWAGYTEMEKNWEQVRKTGNVLMSGNIEAAMI
jgi:carboxylesterase type B